MIGIYHRTDNTIVTIATDEKTNRQWSKILHRKLKD